MTIFPVLKKRPLPIPPLTGRVKISNVSTPTSHRGGSLLTSDETISKGLFHKITVNRNVSAPTWFLALATSLLLVACSDELSQDPVTNPDNTEITTTPPLYISLSVNTPLTSSPSGRASQTQPGGDSSSGTVDASDPENQVLSATIYLVDANDKTIQLELEAESGIPATSTNNTTQVWAEIKDIQDLAKLKGQTLQVYVVANAKETSLKHNFSKTSDDNTHTLKPAEAIFSVGTYTDPYGDFGDNGKTMPLVNANNNITITIPDNSDPDELLKAIYANFNRIEDGKAWWDTNGALDLERAVARIEYRDLQERAEQPVEKKGDNTTLPANTYWIGSMGVKARVYSLQLFNINKDVYLFRHTSIGGETQPGDIYAAETDTQIFGNENGNGLENYNWVASPWWGTRETETPSLLGKLSIGKDSYTIKDDGPAATLLADIKDRQNKDNDGYHPWCYVSENTLYSTKLMAPQTAPNGEGNTEALLTKYATGVAFKVVLLGKDGNILQYEEETPVGGTNYPDEISNSVTEGMPADGKWITITDPSTRKWVDVKPEIIKINGEDKKAYCLTYIACIVHNNPQNAGYNPDNNKFAPMYYGVVRNNTYQLSVNSIVGLPLPQDPRTLYLTIECSIAPWNDRWDEDVTLY